MSVTNNNGLDVGSLIDQVARGGSNSPLGGLGNKLYGLFGKK